ncbi:MAG: RiPP maturation radical SAM C-methyltransferase [Thermodesulfobacteriota bacterium]|nr:RiPP maturation radical SAM C-methyltransferase [Thermodesulfobacteriota bacterium]
MEKIILISAPWPLYSRPSIQIGTLKSYLKKKFPDLKVDANHFYLKVAEAIGYRRYRAISERTWLAETIYAALLYPERLKHIEKIFYKQAAGKSLLRKILFETLTKQIQKISETFIHTIDWGEYGLAGFSICLCQLTASLYFIRQIKRQFPNIFIVVGGSMFTGDATRNLFKIFPEIDVVVNGEGELPLSRLMAFLRNPRCKVMPQVKGIITPESAEKKTPVEFNQMNELSGLVPPDYDDYFELLRSFGPEKTFFPTLPMEISRGCWWRRKQEGQRSTGCAFCNLNLQWDGYRSKNPAQVVSEIDHLTTKYKTLSIAFMDNLLPLKTSRDIFNRIARLGKDFHMFGEIRATTPEPELKAMQAAGMQEVQIGIEALSTRLLKKLNKGTTTIQNIEIMKYCEMTGIANSSNLILYFPGSDQKDVDETLRNLDFVLCFRPLKMVHFWLGMGSPVWQNPEAFGLKSVFNHRNYAVIFPPDVFKAMLFIIQSYQGDLGLQRKLWRPVKKKLEAWKKSYGELHKGPRHENILSFRDGRNFMIIRQKRLNGQPLTHRLEGTSRVIYLFCMQHRSLKRILARFPSVATDRIEAFLKMMVDKKLMFQENNNYLSLAVPAKQKFHEQ